MYKKDRLRQLGLTDFNQPIGLKMNPENRWVKKAELIPWPAIEDRYAELFPSKTGMPAKPLRLLPVFYWSSRLSTGTAVCTIASGRIPKTSD